MADKQAMQAMQADGSNHDATHEDGIRHPAKQSESAGGAYPNGVKGDPARSGIVGHGGQTDIAYHGPGQLGDEKVDDGEQPNSTTRGG